MSVPVALITVTYNSADDLQKHWRAARDLRVPWIVVDNASTDSSVRVAQSLGAHTVLALPRNVGFSAANNAGAAAIDADCYVFVNPDVEVVPGTSEELARVALMNMALVAPQLLNADGSSQENARYAPYFYRKVLHFLGGRLSRASNYEVHASANQTKRVSWLLARQLQSPVRYSVVSAVGTLGSLSTTKTLIYVCELELRARMFFYLGLCGGYIRGRAQRGSRSTELHGNLRSALVCDSTAGILAWYCIQFYFVGAG